MTLLLALSLALADEPTTNAEVLLLDNGLTVILEPQTRTDTVALVLGYQVGSRDEVKGQHGTAHLFEHLMFEGSANVPNNAFDRWLEDAGGSNNAWTSEDDTVYHMTFPSGALDLALFLESDRMGFLDTGLSDESLANQQDVVLQERGQGYASPHGRDWDALTRLQFGPGHPYHVPVIGTVADIEGYTLPAVQVFWQTHYRPRNATLVLTGNFDTEVAAARVRHWFGDIVDTGPAPTRGEQPDYQFGVATGMLEDDVEDRTLYMSWPTVPTGHPDAKALEALAWVLEGGRGTRLDDKLYFKSNLATSVATYGFSSDVAGQFLVAVSSPATPLAKLDKVVSAELAKVVRKGVTEAEVARARQAMRVQLLDQLEEPLSRAELLRTCHETKGHPNCVSEELAEVAALTPADLLRVATTYLVPERRVTLSVVPRGDDGALPGAQPVELP